MAQQLSFPGFPTGPGLVRNLLGNETIKSILIWQVLGQVIEPILEPITTPLRQELLKLHPDQVISPADAVDAVLKGHMTEAEGRDAAAQSGIASDNFDRLLASAGEPPGVEQLMELLRRKLIPETGTGADSVSFEQGVRDSRLKDKWTPILLQALTQPISPADAVAATLRGQIARALGEEYAYKGGIGPAEFQILLDTAGRPPAPEQLVEFVRRGLIPVEGTGADVLSFQQGIFEGDSKDKWEPILRQLIPYHPPPRTVTALLRAGSIDEAHALTLFRDAGLSEELAAAYAADAHHQRTAATRELAKSDIVTLYMDRLVPEAEALTLLEGLGYPEQDARFELSIADFRQQKAILDRVVTRLRTLYVGRKIEKQAAIEAMDAIQLPAPARDQLLQVWDVERSLQQAHLTAAEIADAVKYGAMSEDEALSELAGLGFSPFDAWVRLAVTLRGKVQTPRPPFAPLAQ